MVGLAWLALAGCSGGTGEPAWAVDPVWLEPLTEDASSAAGFQTWQFYEQGWSSGYETRHYVCSVVVGLSATATTPCPQCTHAWSVTTRLVEQDCDFEEAELGQYLTLEQIGVGDVSPLAAAEAPHPGQTLVAYGDYGSGYEPYGWAYPAALEQGGDSAAGATFNATEPYRYQPTLLWEIETTTTP